MTSVSTTVEVTLANSSTKVIASAAIGPRGPAGADGAPGADGADGGVTDHGDLTGLGDNDHSQYGLLETPDPNVAQEWMGTQNFMSSDATLVPVVVTAIDGASGNNQLGFALLHDGALVMYINGQGWVKAKLALFGQGRSYIQDTESAPAAADGVINFILEPSLGGGASYLVFNRADRVWSFVSEGKLLLTLCPDAPFHSARVVTDEAGKTPLGIIQTHATPTVDTFQVEVGGSVWWAIDKDGRIRNRNGTLIVDGTTTPEGNVTAPVGSIYLRTNGEIWKKLTGAGNTGWVRILDAALVDAKGDLLVGTADNVVARLPVGADGQVLVADSAEDEGVKWDDVAGGGGPRVIRVTLDGNGTVLTTGAKTVYVSVPFDCTIDKVRLLADVTGSVVVDIWKDTYANYPPTNADTITASAKPTLSSAIKYEDATLTGWTTALTAGDILEVELESVSLITKLHIDLFVS